MKTYKHTAARQAFESYSERYADYIERHADELIAKGYDISERTLGESLVGNEGI